MNKISVLLFGFLMSVQSQAIQWQITGQESKTPVYQGHLKVNLAKSLGEATIQILDAN